MKTKLDELSELELKDITLSFDGAEGGCFWLMTRDDDMYKLSISETITLNEFLKFWLKRIEKVSKKKDNSISYLKCIKNIGKKNEQKRTSKSR